jgi:hypothetical protein
VYPAAIGLSPKRRTMSEILATMTVKEAGEHLAEPDRKHLLRWRETYGIPLNEFHIGHIKTYQIDRVQEVEAAILDREVAALLMLLHELNLSAEIEGSYRALIDSVRLKVKKPDGN